MDPISLAIGAVGLGMQIFGAVGSSSAAHKQAEISQDVARQEQGINDVKQQQMELEGKRANIETSRNVQRARAMGIAASVNQGASTGSGLQGGLAQSTDEGLFHMQGVNDALSFGRQVNVFNQNISADKQKMASAQSDAATAAGWTSLGGAVMKAGPIMGQISQGFGGFGGATSTNNPMSGSVGNPRNLNSLY